MSILHAIILGIFQGVAEFLPISSSGHLVLLQNLLTVEEGKLFFSVMLHFGTLISIFIVYFKDIVKIVIEFLKMVKEVFSKKGLLLNNQYRVLAIMIIIATIPTGLIGIFFKDFFEGLYDSLTAVGTALIITGILLWVSEKKASGRKSASELKVKDAIIVGLFQSFAIIPGVSRSGSTIVGGLFRGLNKKLATKFSFLLAIPAILGATIVEVPDALKESSGAAFNAPLIIGIILSAVTGIFAIKILTKALEKGKLHYFSYYVWALGVIVILSQYWS
ncbi:undecaprenyl-diphosphate phosphatase [Dethiothermospora halolimnae]|uniref:undecaprenyl-diphosphate phosphatase n=1 Tax=Dethiothermospora halolimnae TaxID=3114390 RepID=UPI003CCBF716